MSQSITEAFSTPINLSELRRQNDARAVRWNKGNPAPLSFAMMELAGEVGKRATLRRR